MQVFAITGFSLSTIPQRMGAVFSAVFGTAGVVAVLVGVFSIAKGFVKTMTSTADADTAIVLRGGADTEMLSILYWNEVRVVSENMHIARSNGIALASPELFVVINLPKRTTGTDANVPLRGIKPIAFQVHDELEIIRGRNFVPGRNEVIVGRSAAAEFSGLDLGARLEIGDNYWDIVGIFKADSSVAESEIWTSATVLQSAYQRGTSYQSVYVKIISPGLLDDFSKSLASDPRLNVKVVSQGEYYAEQSAMIYKIITTLGTLVAGLMALGAVFGSMNTMYTAVSSRTREIATLRALGFHASPVVVSVLIESLLLALVGGGFGSGFAYWLFDGYKTATLNWQSFSQVAFAFDVTAGVLINGIIFAVIIGFAGGLPPALRAARMPVVEALRGL